MTDLRTIEGCHSIKRQLIWPKFCKALVTRCTLWKSRVTLLFYFWITIKYILTKKNSFYLWHFIGTPSTQRLLHVLFTFSVKALQQNRPIKWKQAPQGTIFNQVWILHGKKISCKKFHVRTQQKLSRSYVLKLFQTVWYILLVTI